MSDIKKDVPRNQKIGVYLNERQKVKGLYLRWSASMIDFYFRRKVLQQAVPLVASFKLTYRCNLKCKACPFYRRAGEPGSHMGWDKAIATLYLLKGMGCRVVIFEGGEPMLWQDRRHDIHDMVMHAKRMFTCVAVTTNGTFPLDVNADVIWVSLDGTRQTHNRLRSNSFDKAWSNLKHTRHQKVLVHYTMNRMNWQEIGDLAGELSNLSSVRGMSVQLFYPYGQGEEDLMLSPEERRQAIEKVIDLKHMGYPIINSEKRLRAMIENNWVCHDGLLVNVDPDGTVVTGCYVKNRGKVDCKNCGFTPVAEASGALDMEPGSIIAGWRAFVSR